MRHKPIKNKLFSENRKRLTTLLAPKSLAVINANDLLPVNADATLVMHPNSDLFFLSGIEQEESILLIFPDAAEEKNREILFLREPNEHLKIWEGYKHTKEDARKISGIKNVKWLSEFPVTFRSLMLESDAAYLNSNEYKRANVEMEAGAYLPALDAIDSVLTRVPDYYGAEALRSEILRRFNRQIEKRSLSPTHDGP